MEKIEELQQIFNNQQLYLWILQYGITHELMILALHNGVFPKRIEVMCIGCKYFSGNPKGGPYSLKIAQEDKNGREIILITGNDTELVIHCESVAEIKHIHGGF